MISMISINCPLTDQRLAERPSRIMGPQLQDPQISSDPCFYPGLADKVVPGIDYK